MDRKIVVGLLGTLFILFFVHPTFGQSESDPLDVFRRNEIKPPAPVAKRILPSAEQIVDKYIMALGGYELLSSVQNEHYICRCAKGGERFIYEVYRTQDRYLADYRYDSGRHFKRLMNGKLAWTETNGQVRQIEGEELVDLRSRHDQKFSAVNWMQAYKKIEVVGEAMVRDQRTYMVRFVPEHDFDRVRYFDAKTGLILRTEAEEQYASEKRRVVRDYSDFQQFGEFYLPKTRLVRSYRQSSRVVDYEFILESYEVDQKIPKALFTIPRELK